ncbi:hypothetical protein [Kitasatospora purpeofusca]|uniref:Uncharacterized protein n=1 Tax=Kitasatospora purpeofusca TaxID=67352 RepID=A0ABZ1UB23_9ACTN|nr:hypothetical protein [Kitasatospora purpeofusca]
MSELSEHADRPVRLLGFWGSPENQKLPNPAHLVDPEWDGAERMRVADYLVHGQVAGEWMGSSRCRLCSRSNGSRDLTDGYYLWPEGLAHYVLEHGVRMPAEFTDHIEQRREALDGLDRDVAWWRENACRT